MINARTQIDQNSDLWLPNWVSKKLFLIDNLKYLKSLQILLLFLSKFDCILQGLYFEYFFLEKTLSWTKDFVVKCKMLNGKFDNFGK